VRNESGQTRGYEYTFRGLAGYWFKYQDLLHGPYGRVTYTKAIVNQFFGSRMIRAEVLLQAPGGPQDWRIDRGVITTIALPNITLREADGTSVTLQVNSTARVQGPPRFYNVTRLKRGLRVVIYHQANLPSDLVQVEGVG